MTNPWVRCRITAVLLSDAHFGSGSGGSGIDALVARDRHGRPIIWASHVEGVLRDAARRLDDDKKADEFFGRAGGDYQRNDRQRAVFTSLYAQKNSESHIWRSAAREAFDNRAPKDDTLRVIEYVPKGTEFIGEVELPSSEFLVLQRLVQEVDAFGGNRSTGSGRLKLSLEKIDPTTQMTQESETPTSCLILLLKNCDPLCITATATPGNLIPSLAFVPGRTLLGAVAAWLISEGECDTASLLTSGHVSVSDALPLPQKPENLDSIEVLPAPLSLQSEKPKGSAGEVPWWAQLTTTTRLDALNVPEKLKRPEDDLFVYRASANEPWTTFRPARRVRLRSGRPDPKQPDASLFAIEQIVEETYFLAEIQGSPENLKSLAEKLSPVLAGRRWLRVGRAGAPVEVTKFAWLGAVSSTEKTEKVLLTLTSDLLVRDELLRWRTELDEATLRELLDAKTDIAIEKTDRGNIKALQDNVMVHGFNGTSRLWRMPAAAIRRGSVFEVSGAGVANLAKRVASRQWLGERTHEGFGRFRLDEVLPGVKSDSHASIENSSIKEIKVEEINEDESAAKETKKWFDDHNQLAKQGNGVDRKPSLSQWLDLVAELEHGDTNAIDGRLNPTTAGARSWEQQDAKAILKQLKNLQITQRSRHARFFVRWLRAALRKEAS